MTACTAPHAQNTCCSPCSTNVPASSFVRTSANCRQLLPLPMPVLLLPPLPVLLLPPATAAVPLLLPVLPPASRLGVAAPPALSSRVTCVRVWMRNSTHDE